jgi:hypothetical protein
MNYERLYFKFEKKILVKKDEMLVNTWNNCMPFRKLLFEEFAEFVINEYTKLKMSK